MIFWAVAGPTPGSASSSAAVAVLRSILAPSTGVAPAGLAAGVAALTSATGALFAMVVSLRPAALRRSIDLEGRPATIFLAVAAPTPGRSARSSREALLRFSLAVSTYGVILEMVASLTPAPLRSATDL